MHKSLSLITLGIALYASSAEAESDIGERVSKALTDGKVNVSFRYRYEGVDQSNLPDNANANTIRSRITYTSGNLGKFSTVLEADNVSHIFGDSFNDTINGNTRFPVVADPSGTEVNQAYIKYQASDSTSLKFGRQRINHDAQRFIGGVAWRQNEQTFDGLRLESKLSKTTKLDYAYVYNVNRIFGEDSPNSDIDSDLHLLHFHYAPGNGHKLSAFFYELDFNDLAAVATTNVGFDYQKAGKVKDLGYKLHASYVNQSDTGDNPFDFSTDYIALDGTLTVSGVSLTAGYESLGSDNGRAFTTPLATLHKFNGFADLFLVTPQASGLEDAYFKIAGKINGVAVSATYHQFDAETGSADFGSEIDLTASYKFSKNYSGLLKYANFSGDDLAIDRRILWAQFLAKF
ncbi:hypothetical protein EYS14_18080 [Alteromonadaceae bacterium M269]|nr:hypothetical protein EYS14_18080 [Alteromonadaceae bacterium M269]